MNKELNIYQRMAAITAELQVVGKNLNVDTGKGKSYKAVSERDILDAVKPFEEKYGVYSYPAERRVLESQILESENEWNGKVTKKSTFFSRIETLFRFVNVDKPSEFVETTTFSEGIDSQDKGSGKAMTYGDKYALMKAYKISTGDDPDQEPSQDHEYKPQTKTAPRTPQQPAPSLDDKLNYAEQKKFCGTLKEAYGEKEAPNAMLRLTGHKTSAEVTRAEAAKAIEQITKEQAWESEQAEKQK